MSKSPLRRLATLSLLWSILLPSIGFMIWYMVWLDVEMSESCITVAHLKWIVTGLVGCVTIAIGGVQSIDIWEVKE